MRRITVLLLLVIVLGVTRSGSLLSAPAPAPDIRAALLTSGDLPDGWQEVPGWEWRESLITCDLVQNAGNIGAVIPGDFTTDEASVSFVVRNQGPYIYRGVQHAVLALPAGGGPAAMTLLRGALNECYAEALEPEGSTFHWQQTVLADPGLGDESFLLGLAAWDTVPGVELQGKADGRLFVIRRGDFIAVFSHMEGAMPPATRDVELTDRLVRLVDERLAAQAGGTPLTGGPGATGTGTAEPNGGDGTDGWVLPAAGAALVAAVLGGLLLMHRIRPHRPVLHR